MPLDTLTYSIRWLDPGFSMTPPKTELTLSDFDCTIDGERLIARPKGQYANETEARAALEPLLEAWTLQLELENGYRVEFRLSDSMAKEVRADGTTHHVVGLHTVLSMSDSLSIAVGARIPEPGLRYKAGPLTLKYLGHVRDLAAGRDKVTHIAYMVVTDLQSEFGDLPRAAKRLGVSRSLLEEIKKLSAGQHATEGRKTVASAVKLTNADLDWLGRAVRALVRRTAEVETGMTGLAQLTVADI
jgi:hypothetical protein